ncbi:MAG: hypothetical protein S4CHLAM102_00920 [Chlamydiia bacterium]|nr:hypothetical protein [Chlamydiia bacterium]
MSPLIKFVMIACVFSGCARQPAHIKAIRKASRHFNKRVEQVYGLLPVRFGGDFNQRIKEVHLDYEFSQAVDRERARNFIYLCVNGMAEHVNRDRDVRPYLYSYPLPHEKISVSIAFVQPGTHQFDPESEVAHVEYNEGVISYYQLAENGIGLSKFAEENMRELLEQIK